MTTPEIPNYIKKASCKNFKGRIHQYPVDNNPNFLHLLTSNNPYSFETLQTAHLQPTNHWQMYLTTSPTSKKSYLNKPLVNHTLTQYLFILLHKLCGMANKTHGFISDSSGGQMSRVSFIGVKLWYVCRGSWRRQCQPTPVPLPGESHERRSLVGYIQSMGLQRVGHNWATSLSLFTFMHWRRKWQPTPVFLPGESQGWEPGGLPSLGSHRVWHDWSDLAATASLHTPSPAPVIPSTQTKQRPHSVWRSFPCWIQWSAA